MYQPCYETPDDVVVVSHYGLGLLWLRNSRPIAFTRPETVIHCIATAHSNGVVQVSGNCIRITQIGYALPDVWVRGVPNVVITVVGAELVMLARAAAAHV